NLCIAHSRSSLRFERPALTRRLALEFTGAVWRQRQLRWIDQRVVRPRNHVGVVGPAQLEEACGWAIAIRLQRADGPLRTVSLESMLGRHPGTAAFPLQWQIAKASHCLYAVDARKRPRVAKIRQPLLVLRALGLQAVAIGMRKNISMPRERLG